MRWQTGAAALALLLWVAIALLSGCGPATPTPAPLRGGRLDPPKAAPDFTLTDHTGKPFTLSSTRGKVVMLYFGYTSCPDVCPLSLVDMAAARQAMGAAAKDVQIIFITVDPERDTPEVMKNYAPGFDPSALGLRGTVEEIKQVADAYGVKFKRTSLPNSALGYAVDHSAFIYMIDRNGQLRELLPFGTPREDLTSDLKVLISQGPSS